MEGIRSRHDMLLGGIRRHGKTWPAMLATLALLALSACQARGAEAVLPNDGPAPEFSQDAAGSLVRKLIAAGQSTAAGEVVELHFTQQEVTSFLLLGDQLSSVMDTQDLDPQIMESLQEMYGIEGLGELGDMQFEGEPEILRELRERTGSGEGGVLNLSGLRNLRPRMLEPQIFFKSSGDVILRGYGALLWWEIPARVVFAPHVSGSLRLEFREGQLGRIPLPVGLLNWAGDFLSRTIPEDLNFAEIREVHVSEGEISMRGSILSQLRLLEGFELSP